MTIDECPTSFIADNALTLVADFWMAQQLRRAPVAGGFYAWPATLVDAWAVLAREFSIWQERESERRARQKLPGG